MSDQEFKNRVVIVTGASSGIGQRTAERFVAAGAKVAIFARSKMKLATLVGKHPLQVLAVAGDVAEEVDIERLFDETEAKFGSCEILVNNAGMINPKPVVEMTIAEWDRMFAVNTRSVFAACRRALPSMIRNKRGAIINVASISGIPGPEKFPGFSSYCASKAAVILFTESLALEVSTHGVHVNAISPGSVDTPMFHAAAPGVKAAMTSDQVAEVILFLASRRSGAINGQNLNVFSS